MTDSQRELLRRRKNAVPQGPFNIAPIFVERALGARLWDVDGKEYIDFCGGLGVLNVGHNHQRVVEAVRDQMERYVHTCFHVVMYEPYIRLAERLNEAVPISGACKTAFFNSGAEAVENAVKISRSYTRRSAVVAFERGFHGRTLLAMTLTGKCRPYSAGFGPFAPEVYRLPYEPFFARDDRPNSDVRIQCSTALAHLSSYQIEPEAVACVVVEPVLGEGGFFPIHQAGIETLRDWCAKHEIVLICDEVQTGFGRCGSLFACERYGVEPDMVTMAKSMAAGLPLSGVTSRTEIMEAPGVGAIGGTYGGNPLACAAANAVLDVLLEEGLLDRAKDIGRQVLERFHELAEQHAFVQSVRGLGAMCAMEIDDPATGQPDPTQAARFCRAALDRGLLLMTASGNVIRTLMPLVITDQDLCCALDIMEDAAAAIA